MWRKRDNDDDDDGDDGDYVDFYLKIDYDYDDDDDVSCIDKGSTIVSPPPHNWRDQPIYRREPQHTMIQWYTMQWYTKIQNTRDNSSEYIILRYWMAEWYTMNECTKKQDNTCILQYYCFVWNSF